MLEDAHEEHSLDQHEAEVGVFNPPGEALLPPVLSAASKGSAQI